MDGPGWTAEPPPSREGSWASRAGQGAGAPAGGALARDVGSAAVVGPAGLPGTSHSRATARRRPTTRPNRRGLDDTLKRMVAHANRTHTPVSLIAIDLDHFKTINDTCGHDGGDEVLAAFGVMLRANLRGADVAARAGGEEFVVALPDTDRSGAMHVAEHIRHATEALTVPRLGARITASFGVATLPDDALDIDALLRLADRALYAAKQRGRNRVEAASSAAAAPAAAETVAD